MSLQPITGILRRYLGLPEEGFFGFFLPFDFFWHAP